MNSVTYPHIELRGDVAFLAGTETKVIEIVLDHVAHHWHAEDIQRQHPHLAMAQIHAALAYYYDHQDEIDDEIEERRKRVAEIRERVADERMHEKLRHVDRSR